jgi:hypothetical protein
MPRNVMQGSTLTHVSPVHPFQKSKSKKDKKKDKKRRRHESSSSSSSEDDAAEDPLVRAALKLERAKVAELQRKEKERKLKKADAKRRAAASSSSSSPPHSSSASEASLAAQSNAERLQAWQAEERHRRLGERSAVMIEAPPLPARGDVPSSSGPHGGAPASSAEDAAAAAVGESRAIPLAYFCRHKMVAWELPGRRFASLIGFTPSKDPADDSPDEW